MLKVSKDSRASKASAPLLDRNLEQSRKSVEAVALGTRGVFFGSDPRGTGSNTGAVVGDSPRARSSSGQSTGLRSLFLAPGSRVAIRNYATRNPWIDLRDLEQEAALAALEADPLWEARTVALALSRLVAETRCPVSLPRAKGERRQEAAQSRRVPLAVPAEDGEELDNPAVASVAAERFEPLERRLDRERAMAEVRRILDEETEAARLVLLGDERSQDVAQRIGVSVREVYADTLRAMRALRAAFACEAAA